MAISEHASGTRTAGTPPESGFTALGTADDTTDGVFQFFVDCAALANGDSIEIQVLEKCLSGGTARLIFEATLANAQDEPMWVSPALVLMHGWTLQLKQITGTARSFPWSQRKIA
jgi:hypothetical protein